MSGDTASFRAFGIHTQECPPTRDQRGGNSAQSMQLNVPPLGNSKKIVLKNIFYGDFWNRNIFLNYWAIFLVLQNNFMSTVLNS